MSAHRFVRPLLSVSLALAALAAPLAVQAQNFDLMIQQQMAAMNANIQRGQNQVNQMVQQRMQDPAVQQAWQRYLQQTGGRPVMDYPTFTYNYIYTNGFTPGGIANISPSKRMAGASPRRRSTSTGGTPDWIS